MVSDRLMMFIRYTIAISLAAEIVLRYYRYRGTAKKVECSLADVP
jgi:hypothetical protein